MKTITLHIHEDVISELDTELTLKTMAGNSYGVEDAFVMRLLSALATGETEKEIKFKKRDGT